MFNIFIPPLSVNTLFPTHKEKAASLVGKRVMTDSGDFPGIGIVKELNGSDSSYCYIEHYKSGGQPSRNSSYFNRLYVWPYDTKTMQLALDYLKDQHDQVAEMVAWTKEHGDKFNQLEFEADAVLKLLDSDNVKDYEEARKLLINFLKKT